MRNEGSLRCRCTSKHPFLIKWALAPWRIGRTTRFCFPSRSFEPFVCEIYLRVSTLEQDLARQEHVVQSTRAAGYYIAGIYREKESGARADRPELLRMIADLNPGEAVVCERLDRLSRLPLPDAEQLVASIRGKGAKLAVPGLVDLSDLAAESDGVAKIVLEAVQEMLLKLALQMSREDYETRRTRQRQGVQLARAAGKYPGRAPDTNVHNRIIALRCAGQTIKRTAELSGCSTSQVKRIWAIHHQTSSLTTG